MEATERPGSDLPTDVAVLLELALGRLLAHGLIALPKAELLIHADIDLAAHPARAAHIRRFRVSQEGGRGLLERIGQPSGEG